MNKAIEILKEMLACKKENIMFDYWNDISIEDTEQALAELQAEPSEKTKNWRTDLKNFKLKNGYPAEIGLFICSMEVEEMLDLIDRQQAELEKKEE